jgi:hypothetical protein
VSPAGSRVSRLFAAAAIAIAAAAPASAKPVIEDLVTEWAAGRPQVSFRVANAFSEETLERIDSGIAVTFRHRIEVVSRRALPLIPDKVRAKVVVETTAEYDVLTKRYALLRRIDVRGDKKRLNPAPVEESKVTFSEDEMRAWMTVLDGIEVYDPAQELEGPRLRVRVESAVGRRYLLLIFPADISATAELELDVPAPPAAVSENAFR